MQGMLPAPPSVCTKFLSANNVRYMHSSCTQPTSLAPSESVYLRTRQTITARVL